MAVYRFPPYEFDPDAGRLHKRGLRIKLQRKPQIVLAALLEKRGKILTREELYKRMWPEGTFVDCEQGLNVAVKKLRHALCDPSDTPKYVGTISGAGYRFIADVEEAEAAAEPTNLLPGSLQPLSGQSPASTSWTPADLTAVASEGPRALGSRGTIALVAFSFVLICALLVVFGRSVLPRYLTGTKSTIAPPPDWEFLTTGPTAAPLVLSPDAANAVFGARNAKMQSMLFLRSLASLTSEPISGTGGAAMPFWSPDGSMIGFFADQKLKTLDLRNRSVQVVCDVKEEPRGGTWETGDTILFAESTRGPILKVPASGGTPTPVTDLTETHSTTHRWPESLPDGKHFLFLAANHDQAGSSRPAIFLGSLDGQSPRFLVESDSNALFVSGELLFVSGGKLLAQPLDTSTGKVGARARILADTVDYDPRVWHARFTATPQLLVYRQRPQAPQAQVIAFLDDSGKVVRSVSRPGISQDASVSPDGKTVAALCDDPEMNICLIHQDGTMTRISEGPINSRPVWSPDGSSMAYGTHRGARRFSVVVKDLKGENPERVLMESDSAVDPTSWSPSQKELLVARTNPRNHYELGILRLADQKYRDFLSDGVNVEAGRFSPDGKWVAYQSDKTGRDEIYITSYPDPKRKYLISSAGGHAPRWSDGGRELYFLDSSEMIQRVRIETAGAGLKIGSQQPLFRPSILPPPLDAQSFDVTPKEAVFVVTANVSKNDSEYILVTAWTK